SPRAAITPGARLPITESPPRTIRGRPAVASGPPAVVPGPAATVVVGSTDAASSPLAHAAPVASANRRTSHGHRFTWRISQVSGPDARQGRRFLSSRPFGAGCDEG